MSNATQIPPKQALFVQEYLKDFNGTNAAIRAKYSEKGAHVVASRLLNNSKVKVYLAELQSKVEEQAIMGINDVIKELKGIAEENRQNRPMVSVRALELIGRNVGAFEPGVANNEEPLQFVGIEIITGPKPSVTLSGGKQDIIDIKSNTKPNPAQNN